MIYLKTYESVCCWLDQPLRLKELGEDVDDVMNRLKLMGIKTIE